MLKYAGPQKYNSTLLTSVTQKELFLLRVFLGSDIYAPCNKPRVQCISAEKAGYLSLHVTSL